MKNNNYKQSAVTRNVLVIGMYLSENAAQHVHAIFGNKAKITLVPPTSQDFSPEGFKKYLEAKDERVIVLGKSVSEKSTSFARDNGLLFVELRKDAQQIVSTRWINLYADQQITEVCSLAEMEAIRAGQQLTGGAR